MHHLNLYLADQIMVMVEDLLVEVLVEQVLFLLQQVVQVLLQELMLQLTLVAVVELELETKVVNLAQDMAAVALVELAVQVSL